MFLLIVLCTSVKCEFDMEAKATYHTMQQCREALAAARIEYRITGFCVKDLPINPLWEDFE